jgi:DNA-binding Lrp family transcriptional regulator
LFGSTIADEKGVAASTVRNRITKLEAAGVVNGYYLDVDYERTGFQLHTLIVCTAPITDREELAKQALEIEGVVAVREVMTGSENVHIEVVDEDLIRNEYVHPYEGFAPEDA